MKMKTSFQAFLVAAIAVAAASPDTLPLNIVYEGTEDKTIDTESAVHSRSVPEDDDDNGGRIRSATGWVENIVSDRFPTDPVSHNEEYKKFAVFHLLDNKENEDLAEGYTEKFLSVYSMTKNSALLLNDNNNAFFNENITTGSLISLKYRIPQNGRSKTTEKRDLSKGSTQDEQHKTDEPFQFGTYDTKDAFQVVSYRMLHLLQNDEEKEESEKKKRDDDTLGSLYVSHRRLLVIIGNFKGFDSISCSVDDVHNTVFGTNENSVVSYFHNRTNGVYDFTRDTRGNGNRDVVGPYTITINKNNGCASGSWASSLLEAAKNDGVHIEYYQHRMYIIPKTDLCSWDGLGTVGCSSACNTWIPHCDNDKVMEHELGHNLGLDHEGSLLDEVSYFVEYGDPTGIMGNKWWYTEGSDDIVAPHMQQLGIISGVPTITSAGVYIISPLDIRPETAEHSQAIRVRNSVNGRYYYFSYRTGTHFNLAGRILVHRFRSIYHPTEFVGSFEAGETFMDLYDVFGARIISIGNTSAVLEITFGCTKAEPQLDLFLRNPTWKEGADFGRIGLSDTETPVQMWWNEKRKTWTTSVVARITNNNSPNCIEAQYTLDTEFNDFDNSGNDLVVTYDAKSATIRSGTSCNVGITFETKTKGSYSLTVSATGRTDSVNVTLNLNAAESCERQLPVIVPVRQDTSEDSGDIGDGYSYMTNVVSASHFYDYYNGPLKMDFNILNTNPSTCKESDGAFVFDMVDYDEDDSILFKMLDSEYDEYYNNSDFCSNLFSLDAAFGNSGAKPWKVTTLTLTATLRDKNVSNIGTTCTMHGKICNKKDSGLCTGLKLSIHLVEGCYRTMPNISIGTFSTISARSSVGIPVIIKDDAKKPRSCRYTLGIMNKNAPSTVTNTILDPVVVTEKGVGTTRVVFNGRDELGTHDDVTSLITIQEFAGKTGPSVTFGTKEATCMKNAPGLSYTCTSTLVNEGDTEVTFYCYVYVSNADSWFCKNTTFMINTIEDPRFNITYNKHSVNILPGETGNIDIKFVYNTSDVIEEISFNLAFEINDTEGLEQHRTSTIINKEIGPCFYDNPTIDLDEDYSQSGYNGMEYTYHGTITNNNRKYCKTTSFKITLNSSSFDNITYSYPKGLSIPSQSTKEITITASPFGESSDFYNFSLFVENSDNDTYYSESDPMELTIFDKCIYNAPTLELESNTSTLPWGEQSCFKLNGTLRNNDVGCPASTFRFSGAVSYGFRGTIYAAAYTLLPNESRTFTAYFWTEENTPSGDNEVQISVSEGSIPVHSVATNSPITVNCSERPEAPHSFAFTQETPLFSTKTRITISWKSCENDVFCCGPCTWKVYRDGSYIGKTSIRSFTDGSLASKGKSYTYTVVTYDSRGVASADDSCKNSADVVGESADLTNFIILIVGIVVVVVVLIAGITVILVVYYKDRIVKKLRVLRSRVTTTEDDPVLELELLNEAPKI